MKLTLFLLAVVAACCVSAAPQSDVKPTARYITFIDEAGVEQTVDTEEEPDEDFLEELDKNDMNRYFLFTRNNPTTSQELINGDAGTISQSNFNHNHITVFVVHGWISNQESGLNPAIRDAFLSVGNYNVIVLDWGRLARRNYVTAARGVPLTGRRLGYFLNFLNSRTGVPFSRMHLVGFSLGAHLVGNAGREVGGRVARISALDPAGPLWNLNSNRIRSSDAVYVEGMHTDGGLMLSLGIGSAIGDVDFFPNGGSNQPGCLTTSICSHNRAWRLFAATVSHNHLEGRQCSSSTQITLNTCRGGALKMGNADMFKAGSGRYRANTGRRYPY
ncbi:unnamed protein product [Chilo suppressalis]|uniref:Lipase domain-containing protein n=1 Tax=Chilo suppressalis TaxID=168631 RepID=A0ABN8AZ95_CHISP|nr:unnamed protein product [Chilo suppressalis]